MNKLYITGNLTADPQLRVANTPQGQANVVNFTIAVNGKHGGQEKTTFFNCTAWRKIGEVIHQYARKGHKLTVIGPVSLRQYTRQDGSAGATLEVRVDDFEFLTSKAEGAQAAQAAPVEQPAIVKQPAGYTVTESDELPF